MSYNPNTKWFFSVETLPIMDGKQLKAIRPDDDGYYTVPLATLGVPTRMGIMYDPESIINQIKSPNTKFNITLLDGSLYGHCDHPKVVTKEDMMLLMEINLKESSHHIKKVWTGDALPNGGILIYGKVKPHGPYGNLLEESLQDPNINTAFSIRSLCKEERSPSTGKVVRFVNYLITFDFVSSNGYREACKRFAPGTESFIYPVTPDMFYRDGRIACESMTDVDILKIFELNDIELNGIKGKYRKGDKFFIGEDGNKKSLMHALLQG